MRNSSLEIFETDVIRAAGNEAAQRLAELGSAPLDDRIEQFAVMLDTYFSALEDSSRTAH